MIKYKTVAKGTPFEGLMVDVRTGVSNSTITLPKTDEELLDDMLMAAWLEGFEAGQAVESGNIKNGSTLEEVRERFKEKLKL